MNAKTVADLVVYVGQDGSEYCRYRGYGHTSALLWISFLRGLMVKADVSYAGGHGFDHRVDHPPFPFLLITFPVVFMLPQCTPLKRRKLETQADTLCRI